MPNIQSANALEWVDHRTSVDAIEDSTRAMRRCLDVLNALGTDIQVLLEVGVDAGPVNGGQGDFVDTSDRLIDRGAAEHRRQQGEQPDTAGGGWLPSTREIRERWKGAHAALHGRC